jgi:hypothetical protein
MNKKTNLCIPYEKVKVFKELGDQKISETKSTISFESLGETGAIFKWYDKGELLFQTFLDETVLEKGKQKGEKTVSQIVKIMKRVVKHPSMIQKDKKFQRFQKKLDREEKKKRGGGEEKKEESPEIEIQIQGELMDKMQTPKKRRLQEKIARLENELQEERNITLGNQPDWVDYNIYLGVLALVPVMETVVGETMADLTLINGLWAEYLASFTIDMVQIFMPNEDFLHVNAILKYILYTTDIVLGIFSGHIFSAILYVVPIVMTNNRMNRWTRHKRSEKEVQIEKELKETKKELAEALE